MKRRTPPALRAAALRQADLEREVENLKELLRECSGSSILSPDLLARIHEAVDPDGGAAYQEKHGTEKEAKR